MSDLISRQAAIDKINERQRKLIYCFGFENDVVKIMNIAKSIIIAIPSAQPETVRCKNCVNWIPGYITEQDNFIPPKCGKYQQMVGHSSDDYCSFAERITDA